MSRRPARAIDCKEVNYSEFRTGLTYADVYMMLWSGSDDAATWRYERRGTVLGKWRQIKQEMWAEYLRRLDESTREAA